MRAAGDVDVPRLIRIATLLFAVLAAALVYFAYEPQAQALQQRLDDDEAILRSDDVAFHELTRLHAEREILARRYAELFSQNPEAVFLRELAATAARHGVTLAATAIARDTEPLGAGARSALFGETHVDVSLRGTYPHLLAAIGELSVGSEIVRVAPPSLHRDQDEVVANVPVTIYEPPSPAARRAER